MNADRIETPRADAAEGQANQAAQKMLDDTCTYGTLSSEEITTIEKQIAQEKKPQVALRYIEPPFDNPNLGTGPWVIENVYERGKEVAHRTVGPSMYDSSYTVKLGNKEYLDLVNGGGRPHDIARKDADGDWNIAVKRGSKEYNAVLNRIKSIDWETIPDYNH
jgi:hypothetical protein